jgi:hypothetical protein
LASRNELYERFYLASGARNYQLAHAISNKDRARNLVGSILGEKTATAPGNQRPVNQKINLTIETPR